MLHNASLRQNARANQIQFKPLKKEVEEWFKHRDIPIQTDIWIYPNYPNGWEAVVGAWDRVWIFESYKGRFSIKDVQHMQGFKPNGTLIRS